MSVISSPIGLDLDRFATEIANEADRDPAAAVKSWRERSAGLLDPERDAAARMVNQRLNWGARARLSTTAEGAALLMSWTAEAYKRPRLMRLQGPGAKSPYAYCASLVAQRGSAAARAALREGKMMVVGLRRDTDTLANRGRGVYDDDIVVLNGAAGRHSAQVFPGCTEPGAQYAHRASPVASGGRLDPRYANVRFKKVEGVDVNRDGIRDAGRLKEGSYLFAEKDGGYMDARAFQSLTAQVAERDTNGDGRFNANDAKRIDLKGAQTSMYIHRGSAQAIQNTWSAGCQTIPDNLFRSFLASLGRVTTFYYVLIDGV